MADDNTQRSYRTNDPYRRDPASSGPGDQPGGSDPLAELARLIGQSDPFADFGRNNPRAAQPQQALPAAPPAPSMVADWRRNPPPFHPRHAEPEPAADPHFAAPAAGHVADPRDAYSHGHYRDEQHGQHYAADDQYQDHRDGVHVDDQHGGHERHSYFRDDPAIGPDDEAMYDDPPRKNTHSGLLTAVTLIVCAMVGTAGAYAYRTYYSGAGSTQAPPVITADRTPNKVVPADPQPAGKTIQERVGEQSSSERVVSREEQPVELKAPATSAAPRQVLPSPFAAAPGQPNPTVPPQAATPASPPPAAAPSGPNEPKRVRTVTIRPDGADLSGRPVGGLPPAAGTAPAGAARTAPPAARVAPGPARGAPLSLDPQAQASAAPPPPAAERVSPPSPQLAPPAPRLASAPATAAPAGNGGGYVVQVSSQRSETEAQASFRSLQAKYPDQLGGRSPIVKRADLGSKGVYYRAMVGPFASAGDADQFCSSLKAAGGQCLIQRN